MALKIAHFALINELYLEFGPGLTILTGETGAGKSIIIDAVNAVLGNRTSPEMIRTGCPYALIEATFSLDPGEAAFSTLIEMGIEPDDDHVLVMSRKITAHGKSSCFINGQSANAAMLRRLGENLVDVHGQHDHQSLLRPEKHLDFLDTYGGKELIELRNHVAKRYRQYHELKQEMNLLCQQQQEKERNLDMLNFQCKEIREANLEPGEEDVLHEQQSLLLHAGKLAQCSRTAYGRLYKGNDRSSSVIDSLALVLKDLRDLLDIDSRIAPVVANVETAYYQLEEATREIAVYAESNQEDPERLQQVQDRLQVIRSLMRKYGNSVDEILHYYREIDHQRQQLETSEERQQQLAAELNVVDTELSQECGQLTRQRQDTAERFSDAVCNHLRDLDMKNSRFGIHFTPRTSYGVNGLDQIEFMFSSNAGEPLKPLAKVASGGEMSRAALALKTVLNSVDEIPTLIFDEVDTGVGGRTAVTLADKMQSIAAGHQVLCVSHLPQIACMADHHFLIMKAEADGKTVTSVQTLNEQQRIDEIVRMMGADRNSVTAHSHALEMLQDASQRKVVHVSV